jgi:hypothetical protein
MPRVDFLHAKLHSEREPTATPEYFVDGDGYGAGKWARVRFTLEGEDFEPWRNVARHNGFSEQQIKNLEKLSRRTRLGYLQMGFPRKAEFGSATVPQSLLI